MLFVVFPALCFPEESSQQTTQDLPTAFKNDDLTTAKGFLTPCELWSAGLSVSCPAAVARCLPQGILSCRLREHSQLESSTWAQRLREQQPVSSWQPLVGIRCRLERRGQCFLGGRAHQLSTQRGGEARSCLFPKRASCLQGTTLDLWMLHHKTPCFGLSSYKAVCFLNYLRCAKSKLKL